MIELTFSKLPLMHLLLSIVILVGLVITNWASSKLLLSLGKNKKVPLIRVVHVRKYFRIIAFLTAVMLLLAVWGIDYRGLWVFASSILAVLGVALVAQWSILSNITAGVILFFALPIRIGDEVEIIDGANSLKGKIVEINIFHVLLKDEHGDLLTYPNSLILQRPIRKMVIEAAQTKVDKKNTFVAKIRSRLQKRNEAD